MIMETFARRVREHPDRVAVKTGETSFTYGELNRYSDHIAAAVADKWPRHVGTPHTGTPQVVGLLIDGAYDMIAAILGVLKTGKIYLPLSPNYPLERLAYMVSHADAAFILTDAPNRERARQLAGDRQTVTATVEDVRQRPAAVNRAPLHEVHEEHEERPDDPMYILYTSGSTGRPKGVVQLRGNVRHYARQYRENLNITGTDHLTLFSSFSHDASVMDIYGALLNGAVLHPLAVLELQEPSLLTRWLIREDITIWHSVPTLYRYFARSLTGVEDVENRENRENFERLRYIVLGGEAVTQNDIDIFRQHFPHSVFYNLYGQTESTYNSGMAVHADQPVKRITLGRVIEGTELLVVDEGGSEVNPLESGEIIIVSRHLSPGYFPGCLGEKNTGDGPFRDGPGNARIYRTGDMGCLLPDGDIEFLGRKDGQVKIRGYRVEPGEIEGHLLNHGAIKDAAVVAFDTDGEEDGESTGTHQGTHQYLAAYIVPHRDIDSPEIREIREYLGDRVPDYMIPAHFFPIDKIPLTPSGKTDRNALRTIGTSMKTRVEYTAPTNEMEEKIAASWQEILKRDKIGIHDNFFDLGGNSFHIITLNGKLGKMLDREIPIVKMFANPTVHSLANYLNQYLSQEDTATDRTALADTISDTKIEESVNIMEETMQMFLGGDCDEE